MAIRLSSNCTNCAELSPAVMCNVHKVKVSENYTCNSFTLKTSLNIETDCTSCARFNAESCAHPSKASEGMSCSSWAPVA